MPSVESSSLEVTLSYDTAHKIGGKGGHGTLVLYQTELQGDWVTLTGFEPATTHLPCEVTVSYANRSSAYCSRL